MLILCTVLAAHRLNLVLEDCVQGTGEMKTFFEVVQKVYTFF
jgi:hypothetical protein